MVNVATTGWPSASNTSSLGWGQEPSGMLMPGRVQGWPAGTQRAASSDAERLLATAVGWWDAAFYTPGDRFLRNRGVAGELLNLRLGSSIAPNSNDPLFLAPDARGYCYLPGVASNYLQTTDSRPGTASTWQISALLDHSPNANTILFSRSASAASAMQVNAQGSGGNVRPRISWMDGTNTLRQSALSATNALPPGRYWYRFTLNASSANTVVTFEYAAETGAEPSSWTTLVSETFVGITGITIPAASARVGDLAYATGAPYTGSVYRLIERIDGTTVLDIDCDAITVGSATSFAATVGGDITINRSSSGRKSVAMPAAGRGGRACFLLGTDDYMECVDNWQHGLLNFAQGDSFTVLAVVRQWATITSGATLIAKSASNANTATAPRWLIRNGASNTAYLVADDGTNVDALEGSVTLTPGSVSAIAEVVSTSITGYVAGTPSATTTRAAKNIINTNAMSVGRFSATGYVDMEFRAAAVWRRALTAAEITALSNYYTAQGA